MTEMFVQFLIGVAFLLLGFLAGRRYAYNQMEEALRRFREEKTNAIT